MYKKSIRKGISKYKKKIQEKYKENIRKIWKKYKKHMRKIYEKVWENYNNKMYKKKFLILRILQIIFKNYLILITKFHYASK